MSQPLPPRLAQHQLRIPLPSAYLHKLKHHVDRFCGGSQGVTSTSPSTTEAALHQRRRRTFTGEYEGVEQQLHLWMRCQHDNTDVRLRALLVREPARDSIDPVRAST